MLFTIEDQLIHHLFSIFWVNERVIHAFHMFTLIESSADVDVIHLFPLTKKHAYLHSAVIIDSSEKCVRKGLLFKITIKTMYTHTGTRYVHV